jgi:hypothetical protein
MRPEIINNRRAAAIPSLEEARALLGGKLPRVFEQYQFPKPGIVLTEKGPKVPVYVASGQGFNFSGRYFLDNYVHPNLESRGAFILDPFALCGEFVDSNALNETRSMADIRKYWERFNDVVIPTVNYGLSIPRSGLLFAVCEGYPVDEGMAAEMADFATNFGPVIAIRSDIRLTENLATGTNPAVKAFASEQYGGSYHESDIADTAYESALLQDWHQERSSLDKLNP